MWVRLAESERELEAGLGRAREGETGTREEGTCEGAGREEWGRERAEEAEVAQIM